MHKKGYSNDLKFDWIVKKIAKPIVFVGEDEKTDYKAQLKEMLG